jgi:hypothetical protein
VSTDLMTCECGRSFQTQSGLTLHQRKSICGSSSEKRFWNKTSRRGRSECWPWVGAITPAGYGHFYWGGRSSSAHRFAYELIVGPIPAGLHVDHLCRNRRCVNPHHLEPVTIRENLLRGETMTARRAAATHCPRGHEYTPLNTYRSKRNQRSCVVCRRAYVRGRKVTA